ncbi:pirin family protein [Conservatibacter flavescens]|uniref:Pirin family protein n=1 Tax=Conservatibacter flavescens TaxID=28161 RepID=A0A2M8S1E9_9PAST|nr:pirin family protein [Conservatibacter flavescens]PJG84948.1 pirin family protein [Conservatibacter flavescens]
MLQVRYAQARGRGNPMIEWLDSYHTFSFADYYDPHHMHFSHLRVINEDYIQPNNGFGTHPHADMEILTYVLNGRVAHKDSMGNATEIAAGEFQIMSAGTGIYHSEINPSHEDVLHLYQIWIIPNQKGVTPRYAQGKFPDEEGATLILSPEGEDGAFKIYQDMRLWRWQLSKDQSAVKNIELSESRRYWLQVVKGSLSVNGIALTTSDALGISNETALDIQVSEDTEFLLFDLV